MVGHAGRCRVQAVDVACRPDGSLAEPRNPSNAKRISSVSSGAEPVNACPGSRIHTREHNRLRGARLRYHCANQSAHKDRNDPNDNTKELAALLGATRIPCQTPKPGTHGGDSIASMFAGVQLRKKRIDSGYL